jgi:hypothetical protein
MPWQWRAPVSLMHAGAMSSTRAQSYGFLLLGCVVLIFVGLVTKSWLVGSSRGVAVSIGPFGVESCAGGACSDVAWSDPRLKLPGDVRVLAILTWLTSIVALLAAAGYGTAAFRGMRDRMPPYGYAIGAFAAALAIAVLFAIRVYTESGSNASFGWSLLPAFGGLIAALVLARRLAAEWPRKRR